MTPALAETDEEILSCFAAMSELRPHLKREEFVNRVRRQMTEGYRLAALRESDTVVCCAGFRILENLAWGRFMYIDDLVTAEQARGRGFGSKILQWLFARAESEGCQEAHLDSGTWRVDAHRFYFQQGMVVKSFHFSRVLHNPCPAARLSP